MKAYKNYLEEKKYRKTTIANYLKGALVFIKWCHRNQTTAALIDYKTILQFINFLQRKNNSKKTVNYQIGTVKVYFKYLVAENYRLDNPIETINIKGVKRVINYNLLEADELEDLYYSFSTENYQERYHKYTLKRAKVILGLIVYQGLKTTDLGNLKVEHLQLSKGTIYIPSSKKSNARTLELKPWQIMEFISYLNEVRPVIQQRLRNYSQQLFTSNARFCSLTYLLIKKLKRINLKVVNTKQLRASVITHWLKQYNLRQVQYLAGHRYISATERYLQDDLESLHEIVNNFHPIL